MTTNIVLIIIACICIGLVIRTYIRIKYYDRNRAGMIDSRKEHDIKSMLPPETRSSEKATEEALQVWRSVAKSLGVAPKKLRPTDRFDRELAPHPNVRNLPDDPLESLDEMLSTLVDNECKYDMASIKTMADLVMFMTAHSDCDDENAARSFPEDARISDDAQYS